MVTGSLANLALSYERKCKKTRPIPAELVNEFIWRSASVDVITANEDRLSIRELVAAAELFRKVYASNGVSETFTFGKVLKLLEHHAAPETDQEMEDLILVMETQLS